MGSPLLFCPKSTTSHPAQTLVHTTRAHPRVCTPRGAHRTRWLPHPLGDIPTREKGLSKKGPCRSKDQEPGVQDQGALAGTAPVQSDSFFGLASSFPPQTMGTAVVVLVVILRKQG